MATANTIKVALAQLALLGFVVLPNAQTNSIIIFAIGIAEIMKVMIQSPIDTTGCSFS